jgi:glycosyltransferase involved in cell wall biosynthesis
MQARKMSSPADNTLHTSQALISIVIPAYNEAAVLAESHRRLTAVIDSMPYAFEIIFVNDGSTDATKEIIHTLHAQNSRVALVNLSRNFGKEVALTAGLDHANGDAVVVIDADLQDPPELIPELVDKWQQGFDVVYATRRKRHGESWLKKMTAALFYRLMLRISRIQIPADTGDFRILSRRAAQAVTQFREQHRFMKGLFAWVGFRQTSITYDRDPRHGGETKWNYLQLWNFALEGITSFTVAPLKISAYLGILTAAGAFVYGAIIIMKTLIYGADMPGYPSLMVVILFLGGIQLIAIGIIGEYLGRTFNESKNRPLYFVDEYLPSRTATPGD